MSKIMECLVRSLKRGAGKAVKLSFLVGHDNAFKTSRCFAAPGKSLSTKHADTARRMRRTRADSCVKATVDEEQGDASKSFRKCPEKGSLSSQFWRKFRAQTAPPKLEEFRRLRDDDFPRKKRSIPKTPFPIQRTDGSEILFGVAPCSLALARSKRTFFQLFLKSAPKGTSPTSDTFCRRAEERGIPVKAVQRKVLDYLCHGGVHQGVCLEATRLRPIDWQEGMSSQKAETVPAEETAQVLWLALEGIQDPMNLGAVLRSAHFLGVDGIVMSRKNSCPLTPVVSKASSGAMEVLDVFATDDLRGFLKTKSEEGWEVLGTVAHAKDPEGIPVVSCLDFRWMKPTVLVLGNEGHGLSPETRSLCQRMLTISPGRELEPGVESLNVSVAAGILLHSICAQKSKAP